MYTVDEFRWWLYVRLVKNINDKWLEAHSEHWRLLVRTHAPSNCCDNGCQCIHTIVQFIHTIVQCIHTIVQFWWWLYRLSQSNDGYWLICLLLCRDVMTAVHSKSTPSTSFDDVFVEFWWQLFIRLHFPQRLVTAVRLSTLSSSCDNGCSFIYTFLDVWWRLIVYLRFRQVIITAVRLFTLCSSFYDESCLIYAFLEFWRRMFLSHLVHHHDVVKEWRSTWGIICVLSIDRWLV